MKHRKVIIYFSNTSSLGTIGFDTDLFALDNQDTLIKYGNIDIGEIYLIYDGLSLIQLTDDIWEKIDGNSISLFGFVHHSKPSKDIINYLEAKSSFIASFEGKNDPNLPEKAKHYIEVRDIVNEKVDLTKSIFDRLWQKYDQEGLLESSLEILHSEWSVINLSNQDQFDKLLTKRKKLLDE